jgi:hypothetical protein
MKTAIFYDLENLGLPIKNGEFEGTFTALAERIRLSELTGNVVIQRAYMSKARSSALSNIQPVLQKLGVELVAVEPLNMAQKTANLVDFKMVIDAVAITATKRSITTIAIASGDGDFGFLGEKIKEMGKKLILVSRMGTTSGTMLRLCDDWVSMGGEALSPKFLNRIIETRIVTDYSAESDFFASLSDFLARFEGDFLVRRGLAEIGLPSSVFIDMMRRRGLAFPDYKRLGYVNVTSFLSALLRDSSFRVLGNNIHYTPGNRAPSLQQLAGSLLGIPSNYSRDKLLRYYDAVNNVDNVDELILYIGFMRRSGMLTPKGLCPKRTFRATIRAHLQKVLAAAGIELDKKTLEELNGKL